MIHYTCDRCRRSIDTRQEVRYTVRVESLAAADHMPGFLHDERDHLEQIEEIIDGLESGEIDDERHGLFRRQVFDLCSSCHDRFIRDPLGSETQAEFGFSEN